MRPPRLDSADRGAPATRQEQHISQTQISKRVRGQTELEFFPLQAKGDFKLPEVPPGAGFRGRGLLGSVHILAPEITELTPTVPPNDYDIIVVITFLFLFSVIF